LMLVMVNLSGWLIRGDGILRIDVCDEGRAGVARLLESGPYP
jgi:hypothetical protein